jgi:hypothetical protein
VVRGRDRRDGALVPVDLNPAPARAPHPADAAVPSSGAAKLMRKYWSIPDMAPWSED